MKREHDDIGEDPILKRYKKQDGSVETINTNASPAWSTASSTSPAYRTKHQRTFHGCSKITEYEFLDKLGEGTFG